MCEGLLRVTECRVEGDESTERHKEVNGTHSNAWNEARGGEPEEKDQQKVPSALGGPDSVTPSAEGSPPALGFLA